MRSASARDGLDRMTQGPRRQGPGTLIARLGGTLLDLGATLLMTVCPALGPTRKNRSRHYEAPCCVRIDELVDFGSSPGNEVKGIRDVLVNHLVGASDSRSP